jgi:hypothetical protein
MGYVKMKTVQYGRTLTIKISDNQRKIIQQISERKEETLGSATRLLIDAGIASLGIKCRAGIKT